MSDYNKQFPTVSVIIPMRNEEKYIERCIDSLINQDYNPDNLEILVVDGQSSDNSSQIITEKSSHFNRLILLNNPALMTPNGFNIGIRKATGDIIIIFSAHAYAPPDFISKSIHYIQLSKAECVGGQVFIEGENALARAAAKAMASSFGMGNVHFRSSNKPGYVDTVTFCAYRKEVFKRIGLFDETLLRNQDYDLNYRLRKSGGKIYFTPDIKTSCYSRSSWLRLIRQYFQWGFWKMRMIKKYISSLRLRHIVAPAFVASILLMGIGGFLYHFLWQVLGITLGIYALCAITFAFRSSKRLDQYFFILPLVFATMHLSWGAGFIWGILTLPFPAKGVPLSH